MKLSKQQINALNRSGRAEYDAKLGTLLGEALNKGVGAIVIETNGESVINDAAEGIAFENIRIVWNGRYAISVDSLVVTVSNGELTQIVPIEFDFWIVLGAADGVYDEINFEAGVYIQRLEYNNDGDLIPLDKEEIYPLPDKAIEAYKKLMTYTENMTVMCDECSVIVSYVADTKKYIDKKVAEIQAIILEG